MSSLIDLPVEVICEIAIYLNVNDIGSLENVLNYRLPDYIVIPKYKKVFNESINEIDKITYSINSNGLGSVRNGRDAISDYEIEYYNCNWDNMNFLTITRVGESYGWDDNSYTSAFCGRQYETKRVSVFVYKNHTKKQGKLMTHYYEIRH